ncbi:MAG: hypothetical protein M3036_15975, partial [Bifidobacteriales bacterium]|nr:hypothetical protein [Bifidobacteriales bacterium]
MQHKIDDPKLRDDSLTNRPVTTNDSHDDESDRITIRGKPMPNPSIITITDLGFAYPSGSSAIFELLSATLDRGWTAILGDNSCGK